MKEKTAANGLIDKDALKKIKQEAITYARAKFGAQRKPIVIDDREWEAIQKGAITDNVLSSILLHSDADSLRSRATPRNHNNISNAKLNKLKAMLASGYTNSEIAEALGVSVSTVVKNM